MNIRQINEELDRILNEESTEDLLSFCNHEELLKSDGDFDDYLCYKEGKGYCITSITYEYEKPQINYRTEWYPTKEEAKFAFEKELNVKL